MYDDKAHLDGVDIWPELLGYSSTGGAPYNDVKHFLQREPLSKRRPIFFYCNKNLMAIRYGQYKVIYITKRCEIKNLISDSLHDFTDFQKFYYWS